MKMNEAASCASCPYFKPRGEEGGGQCLRFPPQFAMTTAIFLKQTLGGPQLANEVVMRAEFPIVSSDARCGEHPDALVVQ